MSAITWLGAWLLFLIILLAIAQTKWGHTIAYYLIWLAILFLVVSHYQQILSIFQAGGITSSGQS